MIKMKLKGFTLIELLVVITIIGILATGAVSTFTSQIQKARDSTRISDVKVIQTAVEQVYQDTSLYPKAVLTDFQADVVDYLPNLPEDSKNAQSCSPSVAPAPATATTTMCGYVYNVGHSNGGTSGIAQAVYEISAGFENSGNVKNKNNNDDGDDPARYESSNNPTVAPPTIWASGLAPANGFNVKK